MFKRYAKTLFIDLFIIALFWGFFEVIIHLMNTDDNAMFITLIFIFMAATVLMIKQRLYKLLKGRVSNKAVNVTSNHALKLSFGIAIPLAIALTLIDQVFELFRLADIVLIASIVFTLIYSFSINTIIPKKVKDEFEFIKL